MSAPELDGNFAATRMPTDRPTEAPLRRRVLLLAEVAPVVLSLKYHSMVLIDPDGSTMSVNALG